MTRPAKRVRRGPADNLSHDPLSAASRHPRLELAATLIVAATLVAAVHWPVLDAQARSMDDNLFVTNNVLVSHPGWASIRRFFGEVSNPSSVGGYYLPLTMTSLMVDYALGGRAAGFAAFHRTSLAIHVLNVVLLGLILYGLFGSPIPAALAALLFGLHPLTVEPVAWVSERKSLLATLFSFACILCYVRHARRPRGPWLLASAFSYALALLSKPSVTTVPILLWLLDWWPLKRWSRAAVVEKWPFFLLAAASIGVSIVSLAHTGGITPIAHVGFTRPVLQVCYLLVFYVEKILWPVGLSCMYTPPESFAISNPLIAWSVAAVALALIAAAVLLRRAPGVAASAVIFVVALSPTFAILKWSHFIAYDRYLYFPSIGILLLVGLALSAAWNANPMRATAAKTALIAVVFLISVAEASGVRATLANWRNSVALWRNVVTISPREPGAHQELGIALEDQGDYDGAAQQYRLILSQDPDYVLALIGLGDVLTAQGQYADAVRPLERACYLRPNDPQASYSLGLAEKGAGNLMAAEARFRHTVQLSPNNIAALDQLGTVLVMRERTQEGVAVIRRALALDPTDAHPHFSLAMVLLHVGGAHNEALDHLRRAVQLRPDWVLPTNALAWVLATNPVPALRNSDEALRLAAQANEMTHHLDPNTLDTYAVALAASGRFDQAIETARQAAELADHAGNRTLADGIRGRIRDYVRGAAYTDSSSAR